MTAVPPASARPAAPPAAPQTAPPEVAAPRAAQQPPAAAPADDRSQQVASRVGGSLLTGALFVGAGLAIAFAPFLAPLFVIAGCVAGADWLADLAGFSPVKAFTGKSLGGWVATPFMARPDAPEASGVNPRRGPVARPRAPAETPPERRPQEPALPAPAPVPVPVPTS